MNFNTFTLIVGLSLTTVLAVPAFAVNLNPVNLSASSYSIENAIAQKKTPTTTPVNPNLGNTMGKPHNTGNTMKKPNTSDAMTAPHSNHDAMSNPHTGTMSNPRNTTDAMTKPDFMKK